MSDLSACRTESYCVAVDDQRAVDRIMSFDQHGVRDEAGDGLRLIFTVAEGSTWHGVFAEGLTRYTAVMALRAQQHCCVVARGQSYLVDVMRPEFSVSLSSGDTMSCVHDRGTGLLLLISCIDVICIHASGEWLRSERVAADEIRSVSVLGDTIRGEGWWAETGEWVEFVIDARTGLRG